MANAPAENLVQLGIGGWQVPREGVKVCRERGTNVLTVTPTSATHGPGGGCQVRDRARHRRHRLRLTSPLISTASTPVSLPGTRLARAGGLLPREALKLLELIVRHVPGLRPSRWWRCRPLTNISDMDLTDGYRVICDVMAHLVVSGQLPRKEKPFLAARSLQHGRRSEVEIGPCTKST